MRVLRRPLLIVAVLFGLDYLAWMWSLSGSRGTVGLVSGPLLVLLAVALVWLALKQVARVLTDPRRVLRPGRSARRAAGTAGAMRYGEDRAAMTANPADGAPPSHDEQAPVGSGPSSSSAQIAA